MSAERLLAMSDDELGRVLRDAHLGWPSTPDVAQAVSRRIARSPRTARGTSPRLLAIPRGRKVLLLVAAIVLALAAAAGAARLLWDLGAVVVRFEPSPSLPPLTFPPEALGTPVPVPRAEEIAGLDAPAPSFLGPPDAAWVDEVAVQGITARRISLAWSPRHEVLPAIEGTEWGAVLIVFRGEVEIAAKEVPSTGLGAFSRIRRGDFTGYWIDAAHSLTLLGEEGPQDYTVSGRVLLWEHEPGVVLRLETALPKAGAVQVAISMR